MTGDQAGHRRPRWRDMNMTTGARHAVVFLFVLMVALSAANLIFTSRQVNDTRAASASVVQLCQLGNTSRAQQVVLWDHVAAVAPPPPGETPAQKRRRLATTRAFLAYVHRVLAPRNCTGRFGH